MKVEITSVENHRFEICVNGEVADADATRAQVKDFLDGIDMRSYVTFDGERIFDYDDVDMWFAPRH